MTRLASSPNHSANDAPYAISPIASASGFPWGEGGLGAAAEAREELAGNGAVSSAGAGRRR